MESDTDEQVKITLKTLILISVFHFSSFSATWSPFSFLSFIWLSNFVEMRLILVGEGEQCLTLAFYFQLILYLSFNQAVKLHSMRIKGPSDNGPKTLKLFINQPHTIDFDTAESANPVQELK